LPKPAKGWRKLPDETDDSIQANIARIKCFRNELSHRSSTAICESEFEEKWNLISSSLERIQVYIHKQNIQCIKSDPIDGNKCQTLEDIMKKWRQLDQEESKFILERSSSLPDQRSEESVYGRFNEIALVTL